MLNIFLKAEDVFPEDPFKDRTSYFRENAFYGFINPTGRGRSGKNQDKSRLLKSGLTGTNTPLNIPQQIIRKQREIEIKINMKIRLGQSEG